MHTCAWRKRGEVERVHHSDATPLDMRGSSRVGPRVISAEKAEAAYNCRALVKHCESDPCRLQ